MIVLIVLLLLCVICVLSCHWPLGPVPHLLEGLSSSQFLAKVK